MISRRQFIVGAAAGIAAWPILRASGTRIQTLPAAGDGRFTSRVKKPTQAIVPGEHSLPQSRARPSTLLVPKSYVAGTAAPLIVVLHGAGGAGINQLNRYRPYAEAAGAIVLAPNSAGPSWDAIRGTFSEDATHIDAALGWIIDRCSIDTKRIAIGGFSDGATYALSLGLINGDLFTHCVAMSPGFVIADKGYGEPEVFIAHGTQDTILPIDRCGRRIARELRAAGYKMSYHEFDGPHTMLESMLPVAASFMGWKA